MADCAIKRSFALTRSFFRICIWRFMASRALSAAGVGCSWRIFSILLASATTPSICVWPSFRTSAAKERSRAPKKASTACRSTASLSWGCSLFANFSASPANSIISFVPLVRFLRATHASSLTDPAPKRDNRVSLAMFHVVSSSKPAKMLFPVAPMRS